MRVAIYCRISDDREGRELGVGRQEADCRKLCEREGWTVVDIYVDNDLSAGPRSRKARPAYQRMIKDVRAGRIDAVVAYKTSRLTRKPRETLDHIDMAGELGTVFRFVKAPALDLNTAAGRKTMRRLTEDDVSYSEDVGEQVVRAAEQRAADGVWHGGRRSFGWEADGVTPLEPEFGLLRNAIMRVVAGESVYTIRGEWYRAGVTMPSGKFANVPNLKRLLLKPRNAGLRQYRGEIVGKAVWKAPVTEDEWRRLCTKLAPSPDPDRRVPAAPHLSEKLLGTGVFRCGHCRNVCYSGGTTVDGAPRYRCGTMCLHKTAKPVDEYVIAEVARLLDEADKDVRHPVPLDLSTPLVRETERLEAEIREVQAAFDNREISAAQWRSMTASRNKELRETTEELGRVVDDYYASLPLTSATFGRMPTEQKRQAIDERFAVTLLRAKRGRNRFDPDTVKVEWLKRR